MRVDREHGRDDEQDARASAPARDEPRIEEQPHHAGRKECERVQPDLEAGVHHERVERGEQHEWKGIAFRFDPAADTREHGERERGAQNRRQTGPPNRSVRFAPDGFQNEIERRLQLVRQRAAERIRGSVCGRRERVLFVRPRAELCRNERGDGEIDECGAGDARFDEPAGHYAARLRERVHCRSRSATAASARPPGDFANSRKAIAAPSRASAPSRCASRKISCDRAKSRARA